VSLIQGLGLCVAGLAVCVIALALAVHSMSAELYEIHGRLRSAATLLHQDVSNLDTAYRAMSKRLTGEAAKWSNLSDISDEHQRAIDGFTNLQILHAANMSQVLSEVDKIRADRRWFGYRKDDN
jgi:hypothetical protein